MSVLTMRNYKKPMLAAKATIEQIEKHLPMLGSKKLDGVRATVQNGVVLSRSLKPIPNEYIQLMLGVFDLEGEDGELIIGPSNAPDVYRTTVSGVMRIAGEPDFTFHTFDNVYRERSYSFHSSVENEYCVAHGYELLLTVNEVLEYETKVLNEGYEGVILRAPGALYKHGRSTVKQGHLLKLKRFVDAEAVVIGVEELMHNDNEAVTNELGRTARSSHKEGKRPAGVLGALVCKTMEGVQFNIGTGFTAGMRERYWKQDLIGELIKYKYFDVGIKVAPRHPVFLGFRNRIDT